MSYLNKINYQYWDIKEAVETTMKERDCTEDSAISFLRTDLEKMNHKTAQNWKTDWKVGDMNKIDLLKTVKANFNYYLL